MRLLTLNIEGNKHLTRVLPFLSSEKPDIVCLQEVFVDDFDRIQKTLGFASGHFVPTSLIRQGNGVFDREGEWGVGILSRFTSVQFNHAFYRGEKDSLSVFTAQSDPSLMYRAVVWAKIQAEGKTYTIATTHFSWSKNGESTADQLADWDKLSAILKPLHPLILCGDFNAPRGRQTYQAITQEYIDHVPAHITTTLDWNLHKVPGLSLVVDYLFSQPPYEVRGIRVVDGVSDHMGIIADISAPVG